jgi:hypothetical protein
LAVRRPSILYINHYRTSKIYEEFSYAWVEHFKVYQARFASAEEKGLPVG